MVGIILFVSSGSFLFYFNCSGGMKLLLLSGIDLDSLYLQETTQLTAMCYKCIHLMITLEE